MDVDRQSVWQRQAGRVGVDEDVAHNRVALGIVVKDRQGAVEKDIVRDGDVAGTLVGVDARPEEVDGEGASAGIVVGAAKLEQVALIDVAIGQDWPGADGEVVAVNDAGVLTPLHGIADRVVSELEPILIVLAADVLLDVEEVVVAHSAGVVGCRRGSLVADDA